MKGTVYRLIDRQQEHEYNQWAQQAGQQSRSFSEALQLAYKQACSTMVFHDVLKIFPVFFGPSLPDYCEQGTHKFCVYVQACDVEVVNPFHYGCWNDLSKIDRSSIPSNLDLLVHCDRGQLNTKPWVFCAQYDFDHDQFMVNNSKDVTDQSIAMLYQHFASIYVQVYKDYPIQGVHCPVGVAKNQSEEYNQYVTKQSKKE